MRDAWGLGAGLRAVNRRVMLGVLEEYFVIGKYGTQKMLAGGLGIGYFSIATPRTSRIVRGLHQRESRSLHAAQRGGDEHGVPAYEVKVRWRAWAVGRGIHSSWNPVEDRYVGPKVSSFRAAALSFTNHWGLHVPHRHRSPACPVEQLPG